MSTVNERIIKIPRPHKMQAVVISIMARFAVVCCGRRFGKTLLGIYLLMRYALDGHPVAWCAPTYKMLLDVWRDVVERLEPVTLRKSEQDRRLELVTGGTIDFWSLDNPDSIRGKHYKLVIMDEFAMVSGGMDVWHNIIRPTLIDLIGRALFLSTPRGRNAFYELYQLGLTDVQDWSSHHYTSYDNPYLDAGELDAMRYTMTESAWRQEIMAEFLEGEGSVFRNLDTVIVAETNEPYYHRDHTIVFGADWGKQDDYTAISLGCVDCGREVAIDRFNQIDYALQRQRIMAITTRWGTSGGLVETNSIGEPVLEQLIRDGLRVSGFATTNQSKLTLIEDMALDLELGRVQLIKNAVWRSELEAYERQRTKTGLWTYNAPAGLHDDTVVARALMLRAMRTFGRAASIKREEYNPWTRIGGI